ncbi:MAG TPA: GAF domain-containing protein, partial [Candidatus Lustribacter sp.]|nr:GAF domain-containing protein [Candidatus Lustribacter sp.]
MSVTEGRNARALPAQASPPPPASVRTLLDAVVAVGSDLHLSEVLARVVRSACDLVDAEYGALGVLRPGGDDVVEFIVEGISSQERVVIGELPRGAGILGLLVRDPRPLRLADLTKHPSFRGFPPGHPPMRTFLGAPVRVRGVVFGNLYLTEKRGGGPFTDNDEAIVTTLAAATGVAIDNARIY